MDRLSKLIALLAFTLIANTVFAATTRTVTITPAGQGGTYNSLSAAEDAEDNTGDLVSRDEIVVFQISGDWSGGADTTAVTIDGWTTDSTHYIEIRTTGSALHDGKWNTSKYILSQTSGATTMLINEAYTRVIGLQIYNGRTTGNAIGLQITTGGDNSTVDRCIFKGFAAQTLGYNIGLGLYVAGCVVKNCIAFDQLVNNAASAGFYFNANSTVLNATAYGCIRGFNRAGGTITLTNCLAQACTDGFNGTFTATTCASDIASDLASGQTATGTVTFVDTGSDDYHLASNDTIALNAGTDLSTTFTTDIDGQTRSGTWDIGADEYISGAVPMLMLPGTMLR